MINPLPVVKIPLLSHWSHEPRLQRLPTLGIVILLNLAAHPESPLGDPNHQAALEHESHAPLAHLDRLEHGLAGPLVRGGVGPVRAHDVVQAGARGPKPGGGLGVVLSVDEAHELGHGVAVVPRRAEGVLLDEPARGEDDEVGDGGAGMVGLGGQDGEDGRVRVVVRDAADGAEAAEVVLVRVVLAVPGHDVEGCVGLAGGEEVAGELAQQAPVARPVLVEGGHRALEVSGVGETVATDRT